MLRDATQTTRELAVFTPFGEDVLLLKSFDGRESVSSLFEFQLELLSADPALAANQIVGRNVTFLLKTADSTPRFFNGYVQWFAYVNQDAMSTTYRANVVPWLWFLTQTADCRIFQHQTAPQIIEQIFTDLGFTDFQLTLRASYEPREYCVQYRETDFAFVSRLMEEEGIFYFFRHENGKHTLVLADSTSHYFPLPEAEVDYGDPDGKGDLVDQITGWNHDCRFHSGRIGRRDYNFQTPSTDLSTDSTTSTPLPNIQVFERYDYPGAYQESGRGSRLAKVRMQEQETKYSNVEGTGTYRSFCPAGTFKVKSHLTNSEVGREFMVTSVTHSASVGGTYITGTDDSEFSYRNSFSCLPSSVTCRPPQQTPRPIVDGIQTAVVVGPAGEEIFTDEHGRVKVQFPWDREGSLDENSSCWMRVSQIHAGNGWGNMDIPRIGEEVIVNFLEGNPDRPIIKGRVYNGRNRPPFELPAQKTRSDGKTDTYKGSGYNEMSMDDTQGQEQLRTNAQHNMDSSVGNNQSLKVGADRSEDIVNNDTLTVAVDATDEVGNDKSVTVGNDQEIDVAGNVVIEAGTSITLACGASTIHMNQAGVITISGQYITSAATALNNIAAPLTEIVGSALLTQAGAVCLDLSAIKHVKASSCSVLGSSVNMTAGGNFVAKGAPLRIGEAGAPIMNLLTGATANSGAASVANAAISQAVKTIASQALRQAVKAKAMQFVSESLAKNLPAELTNALSGVAGQVAGSVIEAATPYLGAALGTLWNLPNTAMGLVLGGTGHLVSETVQGVGELMGYDLPEPELQFKDGNLEFQNNIFMFDGAMTLGNVIMYGKGEKGDDNGLSGTGWGGLGPDDIQLGHTVRSHEQQHVQQGQILGPLYLPAILATYGYGYARDREVHGPHSYMEVGPMANPPRPWPWK